MKVKELEEYTKTFKRRALRKHERGAREHGDWQDIHPLEEIENELYDLYNYASHPVMDIGLSEELRNNALRLWIKIQQYK
jgi:hypothetical protein